MTVNGLNLLSTDRTEGTFTDPQNPVRAFEYDKYYVGFTISNIYGKWAIKTYDVKNDSVAVEVLNNGYGVGFPIKVQPNKTYHVGFKTDRPVSGDEGKTAIQVAYYDKDGNFIKYSQSVKFEFLTPENCETMLVVFRPAKAEGEIKFTEIMVSTNTVELYRPYYEAEYIADKSGNVNAVQSVYETVIISCDADAIINIQYNQDVNKALDYRPNRLYGKTLAATGDSITAATYNVPSGSYAAMIARANNMNYQCEAIWGSVIAKGVIEKGEPVLSILDTLDKMRADADYIILSGGLNDFYKILNGIEPLGQLPDFSNIQGVFTNPLDENTFYGAFQSLLKKTIAKWPGKKILYVITHKASTITKVETEYIPNMIKLLEAWGVPYVDLYHGVPSLTYFPGFKEKYTFNADGWHPTEEGYKLFYVPQVESKLKEI